MFNFFTRKKTKIVRDASEIQIDDLATPPTGSTVSPKADSLPLYDASASETQRVLLYRLMESVNPGKIAVVHSHFWNVFDAHKDFIANNSGAGSFVSATGIWAGDCYGVVRCGTGTSPTGFTGLSTSPQAFTFGSGEAHFETKIRMAGPLSDGTDTYVLHCGHADTTSAEPVDGVYFRYSHSLSAGNWELVAMNNSVSAGSVLDTGVVFAINTQYILKIVVNAAGTSAEGWINGVSIGTVTANIPVGGGRNTGVIPIGMRNTLGSVGNRSVDIDYCSAWFLPTVEV